MSYFKFQQFKILNASFYAWNNNLKYSHIRFAMKLITQFDILKNTDIWWLNELIFAIINNK